MREQDKKLRIRFLIALAVAILAAAYLIVGLANLQLQDSEMYAEKAQDQKTLTIKLRGNLTYYKDEQTGHEYYAAIIQDATACCAQGIEFVWKGEHHWPQDYPPEDTEVTVTGVFDLYEENDNLYIQLLDADVTWEGQVV